MFRRVVRDHFVQDHLLPHFNCLGAWSIDHSLHDARESRRR